MSGEAPRVAIESLRIGGVDAATARALGPAIERALVDAARAGLLHPGHRRELRLDLAPGAGAADIAAALVRALDGR
jgi:hypothetical protein